MKHINFFYYFLFRILFSLYIFYNNFQNKSKINYTMQIGIDINNVLRAFNEQVIKYYEKCYNVEIELGDIKPENVKLDDLLTFNSKDDKNRFYYEDYTFEIYGCGTTMELMLLPHLNEWIKRMEEKGHTVCMVSVNEHILSMQSTMFFLSKIGVKSRFVYMPKNISELNDKLDVLVTASPSILKSKHPMKIIGVKRGYNEDKIKNADFIVNDLEEVFNLNLDKIDKKKNILQRLFSKITNKKQEK